MSRQTEERPQEAVGDDNEPDDWYVTLVYTNVAGVHILLQGQEDLQHRLRRYFSLYATQTPVYDGTDVSTVEQAKMNDCYFEKKDWRICRQEVGAAVEHFPHRTTIL